MSGIKRKDHNFWLENKEFIAKANYKDTYYLESLCYKISSYIKNAPIPIVTSIDNKFGRIFFIVGEEKKGFVINNEVSPYDFITDVERWLSKFFPQYEVELEEEVDLSDEEKLEKMRNENLDMNDVIFLKKKVIRKEYGIIEKIFTRCDNESTNEFTFVLNGEKQRRMTYNLQNPIGIISFIDKCRNISNKIELRNFITNNSKLVAIVSEKKDIEINYTGRMMLNFFHYRIPDLINYEFICVNDFTYKWKNFVIHFNSLSLKEDCLKIIREYQHD